MIDHVAANYFRVGLVCLISVSWCGWALAVEPATNAVAEKKVAAEPVEQTRPENPDANAKTKPLTEQQKRQVVAITSLVILGILAILFLLLMWMVWWSRRTHRMLREPLPAANRGDELWYLKSKRPPTQEADPAAKELPPTPPSA